MRLVPRQLRRKDVPSRTPYYGGRLTPQVIAGLEQGPADPAEVRAQLAGALAFLAAHGVMTQDEHEAIAARIDDVR